MLGSIQEQLKTKYVNTKWQWVQPQGRAKPNQQSTIVDVKRKGHFHLAEFDNGEKINVEMLQDFVVPLTPGVVMPPKTATQPGGGTQVPPHLKKGGQSDYGVPPQNNQHAKAPPGSVAMEDMNEHAGMGMNGGGAYESIENLKYPSMRKLTEHGPVRGGQAQAPSVMTPPPSIMTGMTPGGPGVNPGDAAPPQQDASSMFKMFDTKMRDLSLKLQMELPDTKLLKLMYKSASDNREFLTKLAKYIMSNITEENVEDAMAKLLGGAVPNRAKDISKAELVVEENKEAIDLSVDMAVGEELSKADTESVDAGHEDIRVSEDTDENNGNTDV